MAWQKASTSGRSYPPEARETVIRERERERRLALLLSLVSTTTVFSRPTKIFICIHHFLTHIALQSSREVAFAFRIFKRRLVCLLAARRELRAMFDQQRAHRTVAALFNEEATDRKSVVATTLLERGVPTGFLRGAGICTVLKKQRGSVRAAPNGESQRCHRVPDPCGAGELGNDQCPPMGRPLTGCRCGEAQGCMCLVCQRQCDTEAVDSDDCAPGFPTRLLPPSGTPSAPPP